MLADHEGGTVAHRGFLVGAASPLATFEFLDMHEGRRRYTLESGRSLTSLEEIREQIEALLVDGVDLLEGILQLLMLRNLALLVLRGDRPETVSFKLGCQQKLLFLTIWLIFWF